MFSGGLKLGVRYGMCVSVGGSCGIRKDVIMFVGF